MKTKSLSVTQPATATSTVLALVVV